MESIYTELALYGIKKECARTDTVFLPISEVCDGTVSLTKTIAGQTQTHGDESKSVLWNLMTAVQNWHQLSMWMILVYFINLIK